MIHKRTTLATILFAGLLAVAQLLAQSSGPKTLTGVVSDSMCGAHHMAKDKTPAGMHADVHQAGYEVRACRRRQSLHPGRGRI